MDKKVTPGEITIMAGGAVTLIFSFFAFYKAPFGNGSVNAWDSGLFPIATFIALFGLLMGLQVALAKFAGLQFPPRVAGFSWEQIHLVLSVFAVLLAVGFLITDKGGLDFGFGFYLMLLGSIALLVGAILLQRERAGAGSGGLA